MCTLLSLALFQILCQQWKGDKGRSHLTCQQHEEADFLICMHVNHINNTKTSSYPLILILLLFSYAKASSLTPIFGCRSIVWYLDWLSCIHRIRLHFCICLERKCPSICIPGKRYSCTKGICSNVYRKAKLPICRYMKVFHHKDIMSIIM